MKNFLLNVDLDLVIVTICCIVIILVGVFSEDKFFIIMGSVLYVLYILSMIRLIIRRKRRNKNAS